jgi:tRNA:m4X modification enzyme
MLADMMDETTRCAFFVVRKKRCCRMLVKPGNRYCGEHACDEQPDRADTLPGRIPCPNDPKHSCDAARLERHLEKCPSRPEPLAPFVSPGYNGAVEAAGSPLSIRDVGDDVLLDLISRVNKLSSDSLDDFPLEDILTHDLIEQDMSKNQSFYGPEVYKHLIQNASLLGHLRDNGILKVWK